MIPRHHSSSLVITRPWRIEHAQRTDPGLRSPYPRRCHPSHHLRRYRSGSPLEAQPGERDHIRTPHVACLGSDLCSIRPRFGSVESGHPDNAVHPGRESCLRSGTRIRGERGGHPGDSVACNKQHERVSPQEVTGRGNLRDVTYWPKGGVPVGRDRQRSAYEPYAWESLPTTNRV